MQQIFLVSLRIHSVLWQFHPTIHFYKAEQTFLCISDISTSSYAHQRVSHYIILLDYTTFQILLLLPAITAFMVYAT